MKAPTRARPARSVVVPSILTTGEALSALAPEWNELAGRCPGYYLSQTFQWADAAWRLVAQPAGRRLQKRYPGVGA